MSAEFDYWKDCISQAADDVGLIIANEHLNHLADAVEGAHENYGMAFYQPPPSERLSDIEDGWKKKLKDLELEFSKYRANAEKAVGRALRQYSDDVISIGEHGEVFRHGGRTVQIQ